MTFTAIVLAFMLGFFTSSSITVAVSGRKKLVIPGEWGQVGRCLGCDSGWVLQPEERRVWSQPGDRRICTVCGLCDPKEAKNKNMVLWIGRTTGAFTERGNRVYEWQGYERMPEDMRPELDPLVRLAKSLEDLK